jgi:DNA-directed RNA polymerase specialized sigma24 family protein
VDPASKPFSSAELTPTGDKFRRQRALESPADQTEHELLAATATGDRTAFQQLYFLYFPQLAKFFSRVVTTSARDVVDALIADAMLRIWHESAALATEVSPHVSIMRIAYQCGCHRIPACDQPNQSAPRASPRELGGYRGPASPWQRLHMIIAALPATERAVIHLVYSGHSRQEVADILGMSCESVDMHLARSRIALYAPCAPSSESAPVRPVSS